MFIRQSIIFSGLCSAALLLVSCSGSRFLTPNPPGGASIPPSKTSPLQKQLETQSVSQADTLADSLDFASAFIKPAVIQSPDTVVRPPVVSPKPASFPTNNATVRILLQRKSNNAVMYSVGKIEVRSLATPRQTTLRGRTHISANGGRIILENSEIGPQNAALPCTLFAGDSENAIEFENASYRGSIIIAPEQSNNFSIVNILPVEDYLRGVVPLEIGKGTPEQIEALKAQAIAARTYTYRRMQENAQPSYDMTATIDDQVYGGMTSETRLCDMAIAATSGMVAMYRDSLIQAYYHSTCGGKTARISDVWSNKPQQPYLVSVSDIGPDDQTFCKTSRYFTWEESWQTPQLGKILARFGTEAFPEEHFTGTLKNIRITRRFGCGRIKTCLVISSKRTYEYGSDKIRYAFRRNAGGSPILRSANFTVTSVSLKSIKINGKGYGHGVGMCQMGAIGRAKAGQSCEQILRAYYPGIAIKLISRQ